MIMITRENAKELLPIIKAYSEGKQIEYKNYKNEWGVVEKPEFSDNPSNYRIKPEPKYRPFKSLEECWEEMQKHQPFGWVKYKDSSAYFTIDGLCKNTNFNYLFENRIFADGTPFGIKEEE